MSNASSNRPSVTGGELSRSGVGEQAREIADEMKQSAERVAEDNKDRGAKRLNAVADTVDRVADQVADGAPAMADWVRRAAGEIDSLSRDLKDKSVGDLLTMGKDFARREPAAFIAASTLAGFALSRLLKSTSRPSSEQPSLAAYERRAGPIESGSPKTSGMAFHPGDAVRPTEVSATRGAPTPPPGASPPEPRPASEPKSAHPQSSGQSSEGAPAI